MQKTFEAGVKGLNQRETPVDYENMSTLDKVIGVADYYAG